jgi:hypothetical protein
VLNIIIPCSSVIVLYIIIPCSSVIVLYIIIPCSSVIIFQPFNKQKIGDATCSAIPSLLGETHLTPSFFSVIEDDGIRPQDFKKRKDAILGGLRANLKATGRHESIPMPNLDESFEVRNSVLGGFGLFAKKTIAENTRIPYLGK